MSSIYERKKTALDKYKDILKRRGEEKEYIDHLMILADEVLNIYMSGYQDVRRCKFKGCSEIITSRNKTGYCRKCYMRLLRKKKSYKVGDALRAKKYRVNRKIKLIRELGV